MPVLEPGWYGVTSGGGHDVPLSVCVEKGFTVYCLLPVANDAIPPTRVSNATMGTLPMMRVHRGEFSLLSNTIFPCLLLATPAISLRGECLRPSDKIGTTLLWAGMLASSPSGGLLM